MKVHFFNLWKDSYFQVRRNWVFAQATFISLTPDSPLRYKYELFFTVFNFQMLVRWE